MCVTLACFAKRSFSEVWSSIRPVIPRELGDEESLFRKMFLKVYKVCKVIKLTVIIRKGSLHPRATLEESPIGRDRRDDNIILILKLDCSAFMYLIY
jgi:hypothetical protein